MRNRITRNKKLVVLALASALGLTACGGESTLSGGNSNNSFESYIQESLKAPTKIDFQLVGADANVPGPSFLLMDTNDGTLKLPTSSSSATTRSALSTRAARSAALADPRAAMNTMDGWSVSMPIIMGFTGTGLADGVIDSGVVIAQLTEGLTGNPEFKKLLTNGSDYQVFSQADADRLVIQFSDSLDEKGEYIIALTNELTDANGNALGMSTSYAGLVTETKAVNNESLNTAAKVTKGINTIFGNLGVAKEDIIYSSWFTTQSVGDTLYATKAAIATGVSLGDFNQVWKGSANPNNVDLTGTYFMNFEPFADLATAISADSIASTFLGADSVSAIVASYNTEVSTTPANAVYVTKGTVKLPYFLEKGTSTWNNTPFESAMPSLAIISNVLNGDNKEDAAAVTQQLIAANVDITKLADDLTEQSKLVGLTLTKADGSQLDPERVITKYNPVPQVKSVEEVPFLLFTPSSPVGGTDSMELVIYQHGITSSKESAYAFATTVIKGAKGLSKDIAILAIDQPLHGERSLDATRSANVDPTAYLNLTYLPVARDNLRQSVLDNIGLRAAVSITKSVGALDGTQLADWSTNAPALFGHSLGGITGFGTVAMANSKLGITTADALFEFSRIAGANTGGQIANLLLGSNSFGPLIKHSLAEAQSSDYRLYAELYCGSLSDAACYTQFEAQASASDVTKLESAFSQFAYAAQTVIDTVDPYNLVGEKDITDANVVAGLPIYMQQVKDDNTVPNNVPGAPFAGTEPLATKLLLNVVNSSSPSTTGVRNFVRFAAGGSHSTVIAPADSGELAYFAEMQSQLIQFLSGVDNFAVSNSGVLE